MTAKEMADAIAAMLMVRAGEAITPEVARERANNIACAVDMWVGEAREEPAADRAARVILEWQERSGLPGVHPTQG